MANLKVSSGISSKTYGDNIAPLIGMIFPFAGPTAPDGWLLCDGSSFSSSTYPQLYSLLGSTTLPNLAGKYLIGAPSLTNTMQTTGNTGHTHSATYIASNSSNNSSSDHSHSVNYNGIDGSAYYHDHYIQGAGAAAYGYMTNAGNFVAGNQGNMVGWHVHYGYWPAYAGNMGQTGTWHGHSVNYAYANNTNPSHSHVFQASSNSATIGSSSSTESLPSTIYMNYIIKAG